MASASPIPPEAVIKRARRSRVGLFTGGRILVIGWRRLLALSFVTIVGGNLAKGWRIRRGSFYAISLTASRLASSPARRRMTEKDTTGRPGSRSCKLTAQRTNAGFWVAQQRILQILLANFGDANATAKPLALLTCIEATFSRFLRGKPKSGG